MTKVTFDVISATLLPSADATVGAAIEASAGHFQKAGAWSLLYAVANAPKWLPQAAAPQPAPGHPPAALLGGRHVARAARGSAAARRPHAPAHDGARPRDRRTDERRAADRQPADVLPRRARHHRQGADLDALSARPLAGMDGRAQRRDRPRDRRRRRCGRAHRQACPDPAGRQGEHAPLSAGAHHEPAGGGRHRAGGARHQGRHLRRHSDLRPAPPQRPLDATPTCSTRRALRPSRRPRSPATSTCRSARGRASASAWPSP